MWKTFWSWYSQFSESTSGPRSSVINTMVYWNVLLKRTCLCCVYFVMLSVVRLQSIVRFESFMGEGLKLTTSFGPSAMSAG
jgi:hypothetical protein